MMMCCYLFIAYMGLCSDVGPLLQEEGADVLMAIAGCPV